MDLSRVDQELMSYLEKFPEINIWDDLPATRVLSLEIMRKRIAKLTPIHDVKSEDLVVPTKDGSEVVPTFERFWRIAGSSVATWGRILLGRCGA